MNRRYRKTIIAGNWKMNKTASETKKFAEELKALRRSQRVFLPEGTQADCDRNYRLWKRAVSRAADWIEH